MSGEGSSGLRVAIVGATGALGREIVDVLESRSFPVSDLVPFASDDSLGEDVEFGDHAFPIRSEPPSFRGIDLVFVCSPQAVALEVVREALRAEAFCIDCSGSLAGSAEVPLLVAALSPPASVLGAPLVTSPAGPSLSWALSLSPLVEAFGLRHVAMTVLRSTARAGRSGIDVLSQETLSLLGQYEAPESDVFAMPVAFDCTPFGPRPTDNEAGRESHPAAVRDLARLLAAGGVSQGEVTAAELADRISLQRVQVPTFVSDLSAVCLATEKRLDLDSALERLAKAPGVELVEADAGAGPSMREAAGRDVVLVGQVRADAARENGLQFWVAGDTVRLAAANAVDLAATRLRLH